MITSFLDCLIPFFLLLERLSEYFFLFSISVSNLIFSNKLVSALKTNLLFVSDADILLWDIDEPLIIENIQYSTVHDYISGLLYEFKVVLLNIKNYDQDYAKVYKETLLDQLENLNQTCATIKRYLTSF